MHIKKGDRVKVLAGVDKYKRGEVLKVLPDENRAIIDNVNFKHKTLRPNEDQPKGGIIQKEAPIHISNLQLICENCQEPTRVGRRESPYGNNARYCKKCNEFIDLVE